MSEVLAFINANYQSIGMVLAVITASVCIVCSIVLTILDRESDYVFGLEFEPIPRLVFMLAISLVAGGMMVYIWVILAPLVLIGIIAWLVMLYRDRRIVRNARRRNMSM